MSDDASSGAAAPGWYADPRQPSQLRYWDGDEWTDHTATGDGRLPAIGQWLSTTFGVLSANGIPAFVLALAGAVAVNALTIWGARWAVGDAALVSEEFIGANTAFFVRCGVLFLVIALLQGIAWLALNRFLQRAHLHAEPTIGEAVERAFVRLPKLIGVVLIVGLATVVVFVVAALLMAAGAAGVLLAVALLLPLAVWAMVKLSFLTAAVAAAPDGVSPINASMNVSTNKFWGVLGRVLLIAIMVGIATSIISAALGGRGSLVDADLLSNTLVFDEEAVEFQINDLVIADLFPSGGAIVGYMIVSSIFSAIAAMVTTSAYMRLYLDSGAPSEL